MIDVRRSAAFGSDSRDPWPKAAEGRPPIGESRRKPNSPKAEGRTPKAEFRRKPKVDRRSPIPHTSIQPSSA
jgi:hypothetical protein